MSLTLPLRDERRPIDLTARYTYDDVCGLAEETNQPHELWDGRLVLEAAPACNHQRIVVRFCIALTDFAESRRLGKVLISPVDMVLSPHFFMQPDIAFLLTENLHRIGRSIRGPADMVVEVTSPSGSGRDREAKRKVYENFGVREYWIVDPQEGSVEVLWLCGRGAFETVSRRRQGAARSLLLPEFAIDVTCLLEETF